MNNVFLPILLAATLSSATAYAFDSGDPFRMSNVQADKPAKAQREKNDGHFLEDMAKNFGTGVGVGAAGGAVMGAAVLNPLVLVGGSLIIGTKIQSDRIVSANVFYSGTVVRGKVTQLGRFTTANKLEKFFGIDSATVPSQSFLDEQLVSICIDVNGPTYTTVCAFVPIQMGIQEGDITDVKLPVGMFFHNTFITSNLHFDFNKHYPRVVNVYCKHDNSGCQNDYESSLGVLYRHTDTEFPPPQYLIDPAIIAADQARIRREEEEKKANTDSGSFSLM